MTTGELSSRDQRILRNTTNITIHFVKFCVNVGITLGLMFLSPDDISMFFAFIPYLISCLFDVIVVYSLGATLKLSTKIFELIFIALTIVFILFFIGLLVFCLYKDYHNINISMFIAIICVVGIYNLILGIIYNIPKDD